MKTGYVARLRSGPGERGRRFGILQSRITFCLGANMTGHVFAFVKRLMFIEFVY